MATRSIDFANSEAKRRVGGYAYAEDRGDKYPKLSRDGFRLPRYWIREVVTSGKSVGAHINLGSGDTWEEALVAAERTRYVRGAR